MELGLECLRDIAVQEYESVQYYFLEICKVTEAATHSTSSKVGAMAFEFWSTFAEEEIERKSNGDDFKNYIEPAKTELITMILQGLTVINFEEGEDDDDWGHALSAAFSLQMMAQLLENHVLGPVVQFVTANITKPDWQSKYSSLIALGSITEGPDKQQFLEVIVQAFQNLL